MCLNVMYPIYKSENLISSNTKIGINKDTN